MASLSQTDTGPFVKVEQRQEHRQSVTAIASITDVFRVEWRGSGVSASMTCAEPGGLGKLAGKGAGLTAVSQPGRSRDRSQTRRPEAGQLEHFQPPPY